MLDLDRNRRATSFGTQAEEYARYRPAPLFEAAEWGVGRERGLVVDVAAGTGALTSHLTRLADQLVAIDLDRRMLTVLGHRVPGAARAVARGEQLPLRSGAAGAVLISSAWHWLDHDEAWPELARVLGPGGTLAALWGGPDRTVPWVADVLGHRPHDQPSPDGINRRRVELPGGAPFTSEEERTFVGHVPFPVADLPLLAASYSRLIVLPPEERRAEMDRVAAAAAAQTELEGRTMVDLPLRCRVWRAVRVA